ncbi:extracellular solute-binding protein, partial [Salipiger bermudensis]
MKFKTLTGIASTLALCAGMASADSTVRFWYHFDNADNPMDALVAAFEEANPDITVEAENIPWNSYYDQLYTAVIGGNAPDAAMVKMFAQPRLVEMGALQPIDDWLADWDGADGLQDNLIELTKGPDGQQYYLPVQYVVLYLYYRPDMFEELGLSVPTTCDEFRETAKALTRDTDGDGQTDVYGFGFRGAKGGHDHWATFTLGAED